MSKWTYDPDDEDDEEYFERFKEAKPNKGEDFVKEQDKKFKKPVKEPKRVIKDDEDL